MKILFNLFLLSILVNILNTILLMFEKKSSMSLDWDAVILAKSGVDLQIKREKKNKKSGVMRFCL